MVCGKCKHEFCWFCLSPYYRYSHTLNLFCPLRYLAGIMVMIQLLILLNMKIAYNWPLLCHLQYKTIYYLSAFVLGDLYVASFGLYLLIYISYTKGFGGGYGYWYSYLRILMVSIDKYGIINLRQLIHGVLTLALLFLQFLIVQPIKRTEYLGVMKKFVFYQLSIALVLSIIYLAR